MKWTTLIKVLLVTIAFWSFLFGQTTWSAIKVLRHASGYRDAELIIEQASCLRAHRSFLSEGVETSCFLDGKIDGRGVSLDVARAPEDLPRSAAALEALYPPGSRIDVLYNPEVPAAVFKNHDVIVLWPADDPEGVWRQQVTGSLSLVALSLASMVALFVAVGMGAGRRSWNDGSRLEIDQGKPWHGWGLGLAGLGITLIAARILGTTADGLVVGSILAVLGAALLIRGWIRVDRSTTVVTLGLHLFGIPWPRRARQLAPPVTVALTGDLPPRIELKAADGEASVVLRGARSSEETRGLGQTVARFLGTSLQDPFRSRREEIEAASTSERSRRR